MGGHVALLERLARLAVVREHLEHLLVGADRLHRAIEAALAQLRQLHQIVSPAIVVARRQLGAAHVDLVQRIPLATLDVDALERVERLRVIGRHVDDAPVVLARRVAIAELVRLGRHRQVDALLHRRVEDVGPELAIERDQLGPRRRRRQPLDAVEQRRQLRLAHADARRARQRVEGRVDIARAAP